MGDLFEDVMAVPELENKKALKKTEIERRFHEEPFPVFDASDPTDYSTLQVGGVDVDEIRDPVFLARVYYSTNQHVGYDISKITHGDSPGAGKAMAPIFQPLTDGLQRVTRNRSQGCSWEHSHDTTHRHTAALKMTSLDATANVASVFASFAAKIGEDIESQKLGHQSTFTMITKFLAPMLGVGPMLPHREIYIDEGDDANAAAVGLDPYFRKDCFKAMEGIDASTKLNELVKQLEERLFNHYGNVYPSEYIIGVAAYGERVTRVYDEQTLEVSEDFKRVAGNGKALVNGVPVQGSASYSTDEKNQMEQEVFNQNTITRWSYSGTAAGADTKFGPARILQFRLDSKQWAITQVTEWKSIVELFPQQLAQRVKQVMDKYPAIMCKTCAAPTSDGEHIVESASVSLNSVSNPDMLLSHYRVEKVVRSQYVEYHLGIGGQPCDDFEIKVKNREDRVFAMYYFDDYVISESDTALLISEFRTRNLFFPQAENFQWVIEHDRRWGCDAQGTKIVALRLSWQEAGKYHYLSQVGSNGVDVGLKEVKGESSGDRLEQLTPKEKFTVEVISRDRHNFNDVGNAVSIATIDGEKRLTVDNENKPITDLPVKSEKRVYQRNLYTKYRFDYERTDYGRFKGKLLKFKSNMQATNVLCLFKVQNGKIVENGALF